MGLIGHENALAKRLWPVRAVRAEGELCASVDSGFINDFYRMLISNNGACRTLSSEHSRQRSQMNVGPL